MFVSKLASSSWDNKWHQSLVPVAMSGDEGKEKQQPLQETICMPTAQNPRHRPKNPRHTPMPTVALGIRPSASISSAPSQMAVGIHDNAEGFPWPSAYKSHRHKKVTPPWVWRHEDLYAEGFAVGIPPHVAAPGAPSWVALPRAKLSAYLGARPRALPSAYLATWQHLVLPWWVALRRAKPSAYHATWQHLVDPGGVLCRALPRAKPSAY